MSKNQIVQCSRCGKEREAIHEVPYSGNLGEEIAAKVCSVCWHEWQQAEIMVINELRLDFMDPRSNEILIQHLREFLALSSPINETE